MKSLFTIFGLKLALVTLAAFSASTPRAADHSAQKASTPRVENLAWVGTHALQAQADAGDPADDQPADDTKDEASSSAELITIELIDGQRLIDAKLTAVTELGVEFTLSGVPMQIMWQLLKPEPMLEMRKGLVEIGESASVESYAIWAEAYGLEEEFQWADDHYKRLNEGKSLRPEPVVEVPEKGEGEEKDPVVEKPDENPEGEFDKDPKKEDQPRSISTEITIECDDQELEDLLTEYLEDSSYTIKERRGNTTFELALEMKLIKRSDFFGDVIFAIYNLKATLTVKNGRKEVAKESFESGDLRANTDALSKAACRNAVAIAIHNWTIKNVGRRQQVDED